MLISRGTKVDVPTKDNYTALTVAVQSGQANVVEAFIDNLSHFYKLQ